MLKVVGKSGNEKIATVYVAKTGKNQYLEFVESVQPPLLLEDKWVLIISTLFGCPVGCAICDAGGFFAGKLSKEEILAQIDYLVATKFPDKKICCKKFKIQFARMGDPALNMAVLDVLTELPRRYHCEGLLPSLSTVAPQSCDEFFTNLLAIKNQYYSSANFQMQFSIHTTDSKLRDKMIPIKKWNFTQIADFGTKFYTSGDKKISLNFALAKDAPICVRELSKYFDPEIFIIKITPINPTVNSIKNGISSYLVGSAMEDGRKLIAQLRQANYEVIISIGELEENKIGSNCGQYINKFLASSETDIDFNDRAYSYKVNSVDD